jgi:hypothetical protein
MAKHRRKRVKAFGIEPIPIRLLNAKPGDFSVEDRLDGPTGSAGIRPGRKRPSKPASPGMSDPQRCQAAAAWRGLWELAELIEARDVERPRTGRPRQYITADIILFNILNSIFRSARATERFVRDQAQWRLLCEATQEAWPDHPQRRLSARGPSRGQFAAFRTQHVEDDGDLAEIAERFEALSIEIAEAMGICDSSKGSWTEPAGENMVSSDGTWVPSLYNSSSPDYVDPSTGEIIPIRHDPDATAYRDNSQANGNMLVTLIARNPHHNERVILSLDYKPHSKMSDATVATNIALRIFPQLPGMQGFVYDMALYPTDYDRLLSAGLLPISKVQRTSSSKVPSFNLNEHDFALTDGTKKSLVIHAVDGTPRVEMLIGDELQSVGLVRVRTTRSRNRTGTYRFYGTWQIPNLPGIPRKLRKATTQIRHNSTTDEIADNTPRTRALRVIPETDDSFSRLFGLREDSESMHHHLKMTFLNGRARSVGRHRQLFDFHGYQAHVAITALLAWHHRTGADLSHWFGRWRPPDRALPVAA